MKKSIFLFLAAILCATSAWAANEELKNGQFLYCTVNNSNWKSWSITFNWYWNEGDWCCQDNGTKLATDIWYAKIPNDYTRAVQLIRCQTDFSEQWNWSKTVKASSRANNQNCVNITGSDWGDAAVSWTTYAPPMSSVTLSNNGTVVNSGSGTQADPYIIEIGTTIKVKATGTKAVEDPDATINYDFKQGDTSKQNGTSTTWTLDATDASTVYTIKLDGYTKVNTTSSTTTAATPLYFKTVADVSIPTYQVTVSANDNTMGTVIGGGEYNENATATLTANPNAGYRFVNWTVGGVEKETATTYSFTVTEAVEVVANFEVIPTTTVYFVNAEDWTGTINAYAWTDGSPKVENAGWPGVAAHKEDYQIEGHDVYSYTAEEGKYANIIFNGTGGQTADLVWTAGQYVCKNQWYATIAEVEAALAAPIEYESVYFINTNDWAAVNIYTWIPEVGRWPGVAMTEETEKIADKDVYSYTVEKGTTFGGIKFNEGQDKAETGDLTWQAGKYYAPSTGEWYADAATAEAALAAVVTYDYYIAGSFNGDNPKKAENGMTLDGDVYKATVTLAEGDNTLKVTDGTWDKTWGANELGAAYEEVSNPNDYNNIKIALAAEKEITVIFDATAGKITFEGLTPYVAPLTYTVTVPEGTEKCFIAGPKNDWSFQEMTATANENEFTITIVGAKETDEYKYACQADWAYAEVIDGGGNRTNWSELDEVTAWNKPVVITYVLMGVDADWTTGIELTRNEANTDYEEYMLTCQVISISDAVKVVKLENGVSTEYYGTANYDENFDNFVENDGNGNIVLYDGTYDFYFKPGDGTIWIANATNCPEEVELVATDLLIEESRLIGSAGMVNPFTFMLTLVDFDGSYKEYTLSDESIVRYGSMGRLSSPVTGSMTKSYDEDMETDIFTGVVYATMDEVNYKINLTMYNYVVSEEIHGEAIVTMDGGDLTMIVDWEGTPVTIVLPEFDATGVKEYGEITIEIGSDEDAYYAFGEPLVTVEDGEVSVEGEFYSYFTETTYNVFVWGLAPTTDPVEPTPDYTRTVTAGNFGTICLPFGGEIEGAELYELVQAKADGVVLASVETLEAGVPYIFLATGTELAVYSNGTTAATAGNSNGLYGTFDNETVVAANDDNHILFNNELCKVAATCWVDANRAYIVMSEVPTEPVQQMQGRRYLGMRVQGGNNAATGLDNIATSENAVKVINNGQLIIIRGGEKFNAQGQKL